MNEEVELVIHIQIRRPEIGESYNLTSIANFLATEIMRGMKGYLAREELQSLGDITTEVVTRSKYIR